MVRLMAPLAYIDPVSGSILLQVIAAGIIGATAYFFRPWCGQLSAGPCSRTPLRPCC